MATIATKILVTESPAHSRYDWVDYAKCFGIILVVYGHVTRGIHNADLVMNEKIFVLIDSIIYSFHMPLFFFLSGLFFYSSLIKRGKFGLILNKVDVILYPYILWSLLQVSIEVLLSHYTTGNKSFNDLAHILWKPIDQFWFLYALFFIILFASFAYWYVKKPFFLWMVLIGIGMYTCTKLMPNNFPILIFISNFFVFFALGIWFKANKFYNFLLNNSRRLLFPMLIVFILSQWVYHIYFGMIYIDRGLGLLALSVVSIIFVTIFSIEVSKYKINFLMEIGYASMGIFLMHILIGSGVRIILQKIFHINNAYVHISIGCIFAIFIPYILFIWMKKNNFNYLLEMPAGITASYLFIQRLIKH